MAHVLFHCGLDTPDGLPGGKQAGPGPGNKDTGLQRRHRQLKGAVASVQPLSAHETTTWHSGFVLEWSTISARVTEVNQLQIMEGGPSQIVKRVETIVDMQNTSEGMSAVDTVLTALLEATYRARAEEDKCCKDMQRVRDAEKLKPAQ